MSAVYNDGHTKLYIDGILVSESTIQHSETLDNSYDILIGAFFINDGKKVYFRSFDGIIDDLRIYNRALSESEIQELSGVSPACTIEDSAQFCQADPVACGLYTLTDMEDAIDSAVGEIEDEVIQELPKGILTSICKKDPTFSLCSQDSTTLNADDPISTVDNNTGGIGCD